MNNSYRVITRIEKKPERIGVKRLKHDDFRDDCGIACTGKFWTKPCTHNNYTSCDDCVCNYCDNCKCEIKN